MQRRRLPVCLRSCHTIGTGDQQTTIARHPDLAVAAVDVPDLKCVNEAGPSALPMLLGRAAISGMAEEFRKKWPPKRPSHQPFWPLVTTSLEKPKKLASTFHISNLLNVEVLLVCCKSQSMRKRVLPYANCKADLASRIATKPARQAGAAKRDRPHFHSCSARAQPSGCPGSRRSC